MCHPQPAAIHGSQFAFSSSLAVYIHASEDYRLLKVLAQATRHINALCWSPVDANLLAVSLAEKVGVTAQHAAAVHKHVLQETEVHASPTQGGSNVMQSSQM